MIRTLIYLLLLGTPMLASLAEFACAQNGPAQNGPTQTAPAIPTGIYEPAQIIAYVGDQPILAGDLLGTINQALEPYIGQAPQEEIDQQRQVLMRQLLVMAIQTKLVYLEFLRQVPAENLPDVQKQLDEQFAKQRLGPLIKQAKVANAAELDAVLRRYGSSVAKQKQIYSEQAVAQQLMQRNVKADAEVTHQQMLDYYRQHEADYAISAKARWRQLTVRFNQYPSEAEAKQAIIDMGNAVLRGAPFEAVAKRSSHGVNADEGGIHDWTDHNSLASSVLDKAIFSLPLNRMSTILKDERGFHIVEVLDRQETSKVSFVEAQVDIKRTIANQSISEQRLAYLKRLQEKTLVWTIFDAQTETQAEKPSPLRR